MILTGLSIWGDKIPEALKITFPLSLNTTSLNNYKFL